MKYVRSIICLICILIATAALPVTAAETEPEPVEQETQAPPSVTDPGQEPCGPADQGLPIHPDTEAGPGDAAQTDTGAVEQTAPENMADQDAAEFWQGTDVQTEDIPESELLDGSDTDPMFGLRAGEEITICADVLFEQTGLLMAAGSDKATVKVKVLDVYYYDHAGYGDGTGMYTNKYQVTFNGIKAIAFCLQPERANPKMSDNFTISKYGDGKSVAKVLYYAQVDAAHQGYFATKRTGLTAEQQFIITHMAAAKAAGSDSWDIHAVKEAKNEAKALVSYAESMPAIQDPEIAFSPASVAASLQGGVLKTGTVTLQGSAGNTAEVTLPAGVTLNNQTNSGRSGKGKVTLAAGDKFTLSHVLPAQSNLVLRANAVGKQTKDYSAYKIKTDSDTQNLGLIFGEGIDGENKASLTARFTPEVTVTPCKVDGSSGNGLQGAVFGLYAAQDMQEADGTQRRKDEKIESVKTGPDGKAAFTHALTIGLNYYVKEDAAPAGYLLNTTEKMPVVFSMGAGSNAAQTLAHTFRNDPVSGQILLRKTDRELGVPAENEEAQGNSETEAETPDAAQESGSRETQGDAVLSGAVYGLYAREDILSPDQSGRILFKAGDMVSSAQTDENGRISWDELALGKYYVKEITASEGYLLDDTEYAADILYADGNTASVRVEVPVTEQVKKQAFSLVKLSVKNGSDPMPLAGAGFTAWLVSSLKKDGDSYDTSGVQPVALCDDGSTELFTDEQGRAVSIPLPYGTYLVRETTVPADHLPAEEFLVHITEDSPEIPQSTVSLKDQKIQGKIRIVKTGPMLTGFDGKKFIYQIRGLAGAVFEVRAAENIVRRDAEGYENGSPVVLYHKGDLAANLTTDSSGEAVSEELPMGRYTVREITAPYGTVLARESYEAELKADGATPVVVKDLRIEDPRQKVEIQVQKISSDRKKTPLKGAQFTLYAGEDIHARSEDGKSAGRLLVKAGTALSVAVSGKGGKAVFDADLPNARYYVQETKAPAGYQLNTKKYACDCSYRDQTNDTIRAGLTVTDNELKKDAGARYVGSAPRTGDRTPIEQILALCAAAVAVIFVIVRFLLHSMADRDSV